MDMNMVEFWTELNKMGLEGEMSEIAQRELEKSKARWEKQVAARAKRDEERKPLFDKILNIVEQSEQPITATEVCNACEITVQRASHMVGKLVEQGKIERVEIRIKGKGKVNAYVATGKKQSSICV